MGTAQKGFSGMCRASGDNGHRGWLRSVIVYLPRTLLPTLVLCLAGCVQVPVNQQRLVSKPNMEFSDSLVFNYQNKLLPQVEPGAAFSGGAQSSGCTSCK